MRQLAMERLVTTVAGRPAAVEVPVIPADASPAFREGLRCRRVTAALGRCPCGARRPAPTAVQDAAAEQGQADMPTLHKADCPAHDTPLAAELAAWQNGKDGARHGAPAR
ncbi:hypothetical protein [Micromonospora sp. LOL_024]|uniref:hypothetical protein n=1 Tax=Micromonospora sp. LOL_024 TaxID=3345412 RepID=UPI003A8C512B